MRSHRIFIPHPNSIRVHVDELTARHWSGVELDLATTRPDVPFAVEIQVQGEVATFEEGLFRVRDRQFFPGRVREPMPIWRRWFGRSPVV